MARRSWVALALIVGAVHGANAEPFRIAEGGTALARVSTPPRASLRVRELARTLADHLARIADVGFASGIDDGGQGIVLARFADLDAPPVANPWDERDPVHRENYAIRSSKKSLLLLGVTDVGVEHAVWDLLHRLGYRQFFPGKAWEHVPKSRSLSVDVDLRESPAYCSRLIWYGYGTWDHNAEPWRAWNARNRMGRGIDLHTGHAYDGLRARNAATLKEHPEYLGLWNGERTSTQFCISNPGMRAMAVEDALRQVAKKPETQSVSMEPADGSKWCQCDKCASLGPPSDRATLLANDVADALHKKYGDRFVGIYAYNQHSPPPTIDVHPRVVVSVATAFVKGGHSVEQLLGGWQTKKATLGVREYYSVHTWDRDLPGRARGGNLAYVSQTIPKFHALGARFFSAESSDNWGPNGLGYYVASRLLWNPKEAERVPAIVDDFLTKAFGDAKAPMAEFYARIDAAKKPLLSDDLVGRLYRLLADARTKTSDPAVVRRLDELTLYVRYVELFSDYASASGPARQAAFEQVIRHGYRMRGTMLIHTKALYRDLAARDKSVTVPSEAAWNVPEAKNPWKSSAPFARDEVDAISSAGIANRKPFDFTPVAFSDRLVPAARLKLADAKPGTFGSYFRGANEFFGWLDRPGKFTLAGGGGMIYTTQGDAKFALFPALEPEGKSVAHGKLPPTKKAEEFSLSSDYAELHRLEGSGGGGFWMTFPSEGRWTVRSSLEHPFHFHGRFSLYFYVPKGTADVAGFGSGPGTMRDGSGKLVHTFDPAPKYFRVPVPKGEDGKLWKFENSAGARHLMTVPPYLARSAAELLLPREVVEADSK